MISSYFLYEYLLVSLVVCDSKLNIFRQNSIFEEFTLVAALDATNTTYIGYSLKGSETDYCYVFIRLWFIELRNRWHQLSSQKTVIPLQKKRVRQVCVIKRAPVRPQTTFLFVSCINMREVASGLWGAKMDVL